MKILVTGKNGQLGQSINKIVDEKKIAQLSNFDFVFVGREELNLEYIENFKIWGFNCQFIFKSLSSKAIPL